MPKIKLLADRLLVLMDKAEEKTSSGIILPPSEKKADTGIVVSTGPSVTAVKPGDKISKFTQVQGVFYEENGVEYLILRESTEIEMIL